MARLDRLVEGAESEEQGTSEFQLSEFIGPINLDRVLHGLKIAHNLAYLAELCEDGHTVQFTNNSCVIKMQKNIVKGGRHMHGMYDVDFRKFGEQQTLDLREKHVSHFRRLSCKAFPC